MRFFVKFLWPDRIFETIDQDSLARWLAVGTWLYSDTSQTDTAKSRAGLSLVEKKKVFVHRIQSNQQGQRLSEYWVVVGLVTLASIVSVAFLDATLRSQVTAVASQIEDLRILWEDCEKRSPNCDF